MPKGHGPSLQMILESGNRRQAMTDVNTPTISHVLRRLLHATGDANSTDDVFNDSMKYVDKFWKMA